MSLIERIKKDQLSARKIGDKELSAVLTTLMSEIAMVGKNAGNRETTDDEALKIVTKFKKGSDENFKLTSNEKFSNESRIYEAYLPKMLTRDELTDIIKDIISHDSTVNMGKVMGFLSKQYAGQYDGKMASELIKGMLC